MQNNVNKNYLKCEINSIYRCKHQWNFKINNDIIELIMKYMIDFKQLPKVLAISEYITDSFDIELYGLELRIDKNYLGLPFYIRVEGDI